MSSATSGPTWHAASCPLCTTQSWMLCNVATWLCGELWQNLANIASSTLPHHPSETVFLVICTHPPRPKEVLLWLDEPTSSSKPTTSVNVGLRQYQTAYCKQAIVVGQLWTKLTKVHTMWQNCSRSQVQHLRGKIPEWIRYRYFWRYPDFL